MALGKEQFSLHCFKLGSQEFDTPRSVRREELNLAAPSITPSCRASPALSKPAMAFCQHRRFPAA